MVTDLLKEAMGDIRVELKGMFKGTRLFRQPIIPEREQLYKYLNMTQQERIFNMQAFPEQWPEHELKMEKLRRKFND